MYQTFIPTIPRNLPTAEGEKERVEIELELIHSHIVATTNAVKLIPILNQQVTEIRARIVALTTVESFDATRDIDTNNKELASTEEDIFNIIQNEKMLPVWEEQKTELELAIEELDKIINAPMPLAKII